MLKKIFYWIFGLLGVGAMCWGVWVAVWGALSTQWPSTTGRVLSSAYAKHDADTPTTYSAAVTYEYFINELRYVSDRVSFGDYSSSNSEHARQILSRYPTGKTVTVYYNPHRPQMSVLEQGVAGGAYIALGVGAAFIGFVLFMTWAEKQNAALASAAKLSQSNYPISLEPKELKLPGSEKKRVEAPRDTSRVLTNYPPFAIVMGGGFLLAGLALAFFGAAQPDGPLLIFLGLFIAAAGGSLAWFAYKGLRLRNIRNRESGRSPWQYDYPWDRRGAGDNSFKQSFRVFYAISMMSAFLIPMQLLLLNKKNMPFERIFIYLNFRHILCRLSGGFRKGALSFHSRSEIRQEPDRAPFISSLHGAGHKRLVRR